MKSKNLLIIILLIIILICGGILAFKIFTSKSIEDGMDYAEEKASKAQEDFNIKYEKEDIQLAISMAMFGNNTVESLTFNNLNEQLKSKFGAGNYTLTGPDSLGKFTLKINTRTYTINSNGTIDN